MNATLPDLLLDQSFQDIGTCMRAVGWDMDFRQLDPGELDARVTVFGGKDVQLARFHFNRKFHQVGSAPKGMLTFGFLEPDTPATSWSGNRTAGGSLLNFNSSKEFDGVTDAGFVGTTVTICPEYLQQRTEQLEIATPLELLVAGETLWHSPTTLKMAQRLQSIRQYADRTTDPCLHEYAQLINEDLPKAIIAALLNNEKTKPRVVSASYKAKILREALDLLEDPDELPLSVSELCTRVGASSSSLNRVFQSEYQISPKAYIRSRCLSAVRDELVCAPPGTMVSEVANKWGFWHMGQFAKDFRASFGELPSMCLGTASGNHYLIQ